MMHCFKDSTVVQMFSIYLYAKARGAAKTLKRRHETRSNNPSRLRVGDFSICSSLVLWQRTTSSSLWPLRTFRRADRHCSAMKGRTSSFAVLMLTAFANRSRALGVHRTLHSVQYAFPSVSLLRICMKPFKKPSPDEQKDFLLSSSVAKQGQKTGRRVRDPCQPNSDGTAKAVHDQAASGAYRPSVRENGRREGQGDKYCLNFSPETRAFLQWAWTTLLF